MKLITTYSTHSIANPIGWKDAEIKQWLEWLNLGKYADGFQENSIDGACLKEGLDDETLDAIGITLKIHRKKLQTACSDLFAPAVAAAPAGASANTNKPTGQEERAEG